MPITVPTSFLSTLPFSLLIFTFTEGLPVAHLYHHPICLVALFEKAFHKAIEHS